MSWLFFHRLHNGVWLFIEKVCKGAPPSIHYQFGMLHSDKRGTLQLSPLGQTEQSPAVSTGRLACPARCVYVRNSDTAGACLHSAPTLRFRRPRAGLKSARVYKSVPSEVGKCPLAVRERQKKTILCCPAQNLKETDLVFLLPSRQAGLC